MTTRWVIQDSAADRRATRDYFQGVTVEDVVRAGMEANRRDQELYSAAAGLAGITRGDAVTYRDEHDRERTGTYLRMALYCHGRRVAYSRVALTVVGGDELHVDPALVTRATAPALPECSAFVGTGARCGTCRIRKPLHA